MKIKERKYFLTSLIFLIAISLFAGSFSAWAEDDEDEDENEEESSQESVVKEVQTPTTSTKVEKPTTSTSVETKTTILRDSDGDGILDKDDTHPTIAEIYIVEDSNKNGIVDKFEK